MENAFQVGPIVRTDNTSEGPFRAARQGELVVADGHSRFYEMTSRGQVFSAMTALAGTLIVANNVRPPAAGVATVLSILNPVGSGVNLEILQGMVVQISGTPGVGTWAWCMATPGVSIIAAEAVAIKGVSLIGQGITKAKAWSQTALTGGTVHVDLELFPLCPNFQAIVARNAGNMGIANVDGSIVVPPGSLLTLAPAQVGANYVVGAAILYAEVPLPG